MDDPWGSPWAQEESYQQPINTTDTRGAVSVKTHRSTTNAATLALVEQTDSPWGHEQSDDDGFGDWASVPVNGNAVGSLGFGGPDEGWHRNAGVHGELSNHNAALPPTWKENASLPDQPKLSPSLMPKHSARQPSPDPWAAESAQNDLSQNNEKDSRREAPADPDITGDTVVLHDDRPATAGSVQFESRSEVYMENATQEERIEVLQKSIFEDKDKSTAGNKRNSTIDVDRSSSRPSSSLSDGSQHEDSPRTSMDDEPKRPQMPRKVSSKIQELVEHFDGLTNLEEEEAKNTSRESSQVRDREEKVLQEEMDDFGDFADFDQEDPVVKHAADFKIPVPDSPMILKHVRSPTTQPSTPKTPGIQPNLTSPVRSPQKFYGPVDVKVDFSILDQLFPQKKLDQAEEVFIPDTVPFESFSSTEERKTWYRISRYGPMLKHNTGDDENYVRVSWARSKMRDETLKIVARWMEEDRLSSQVVLGGGSRTSTLFGWGDVKAPPVSLSAAFAPEEKKYPANPFSIQPKAPDVQGPSSPLSPRRRKREGSTQSSGESKAMPSPVINFGWNAVPETKPSGIDRASFLPKITTKILTLPTDQISSPIRTSTSSLRPIVLSETIKPIESPQRTPVPAIENGVPAYVAPITEKLQPSAVASLRVDEDEEDDEWGDMVSSPNVTNFDNLPSPNDTVSITNSLPNRELQSAPNPGSNEAIVRESVLDKSTLEKSIAIPSTTVARSITADSLASSTSRDPWASADFSSFDSSAATKSAPTLTPTSNPTPQKSVSFSPVLSQAPKIPSSKVTQPPKSSPQQTSQHTTIGKEEAQQEVLVQAILKGLPDLSYMLRR